MFNVMSLLLVAALVSHQCFLPATARQIDENTFLNSLRRNPLRRLPRIYLKINTAPPTTVEHIPGSFTILDCAARGHPAPSITWMRNGEPISDVSESDNEVVSTDKTSLAEVVTKLVLTAPSNGDVFTCVATSGPNQLSQSTTVFTTDDEDKAEVLAQLLELPAAPVITMYYEAIIQEIDTSLLLPCRVSSLTKPQVSWRHGQHGAIYSNAHYKVLPSGDLFIPKLNWTHMGEFVCTAKNMYGKVSASTFLYPVKPSENV